MNDPYWRTDKPDRIGTSSFIFIIAFFVCKGVQKGPIRYFAHPFYPSGSPDLTSRPSAVGVS